MSSKTKKINKEKKKTVKKAELKETKNIKKEKKNQNEKKDYNSLKRKAKIIAIICAALILIEVIIMYCIHLIRESKITYFDTLYNIESVDSEYYLAAGSSNFKYSRYNESFIYEYVDGIKKDQINRVYAEQAKLVKLDKELNIVFEKTFKTDYDSTFYDAKTVGDFIIAVGSYVFEKEQLSVNTRDGLIVKYDLEGNFIWSKNYQILGDTEFKRIIELEDGFLVVGQSIYENTEIGNHDKGGGIIVKYDFDGNIVWENNFGGNKSGIFEDVIEVEDGYIACGKDALNYGMLVKYDFDGKRLWVKNYANTDTIGMSNIKLKDDKLYIASSLNSSKEKDEEGNPIYQYDACVFVYDLNGNLLDTYTIAGNKEERFNSLLLLENTIVAVGYTKSSDIELDDLKYKENMSEGMIVEFDYDGKILVKKTYGGSKNESLNSIILSIPDAENKINNTNSYVVVGYTNSRRGVFKGNNKDYFSRILKYNDKLELFDEK